MKLKFILPAVAFALLFSCSPKVAQPVAPPPPPPVAAAPAPANLGDIAAGKTIYENNCAKCHKLFAPTDFSAKDWEPILVRMQKKAHLDDAQMASIHTYIFSNL
jgi:mono/diheme cytochrome c family protein